MSHEIPILFPIPNPNMFHDAPNMFCNIFLSSHNLPNISEIPNMSHEISYHFPCDFPSFFPIPPASNSPRHTGMKATQPSNSWAELSAEHGDGSGDFSFVEFWWLSHNDDVLNKYSLVVWKILYGVMMVKDG